MRRSPGSRRTAGAGLNIVTVCHQDRQSRHRLRGRQREGHDNDVRLHHRRRRQRRLRAGQPADRIRAPSRPAARGRRRGPQHLDPHSARLRQAVHQPEGELALRVRAGARAQRPPHHPAARQGAGRIELDQRPALHPRPGAGFRPLAPARQRRLELRRRAALLPARRGSGARRRRTSRRRRSARGLRRERAASAVRGLPRRRSSRPACRATTTSTARPRRAPATTSSPRATAGAGRPRSAICGRRGGGPTSPSCRTR